MVVRVPIEETPEPFIQAPEGPAAPFVLDFFGDSFASLRDAFMRSSETAGLSGYHFQPVQNVFELRDHKHCGFYNGKMDLCEFPAPALIAAAGALRKFRLLVSVRPQRFVDRVSMWVNERFRPFPWSCYIMRRIHGARIPNPIYNNYSAIPKRGLT